MKTFNINNEVGLELTNEGKEIYFNYQISFIKYAGVPLSLSEKIIDDTKKIINTEGIIYMQMHEFMKIFGNSFIIGRNEPIKNMKLYLNEKDLL